MINHSSGLSPPFSFVDCYSESNITLPGNDVNNGLNNRQDDVEACRLSCRTVAGSDFFDWVSPDYHDSNFHNSCWCKHSDSGRQDSVGVISGNVNCVGKLQYNSGYVHMHMDDNRTSSFIDAKHYGFVWK